MKVNLALALATMLSASLGGAATGYGQQYYNASNHTTSSYVGDGAEGCGSTTDCACVEEESVCEPWRLFPEIGCGWNLTGFINASANANADHPGSHFNGPVTFLDREGVRMNQAYLTFERVADSGGCGFDWGGRIDAMYGSDYVFTQAAGLELHQNGTPHWNGRPDGYTRQYGLALPQFYGEVAYNDVSVKLGHFYTIIGYQVVPATGNFFVTQPYTFQYGEPFTHTGALATYKYTDELTFYAGGVNGWDKFDAVTDKLGYLGGMLYAPSHGAYTILLTGTHGQEDGIAPPIMGIRNMYSLVFTYNVSDTVQYVVQHDNGRQDNGAGAGVDAEWYGINQYLYYTLNECWKFGARAEWFRDDSGFRLQSAPVRLGGLGALAAAGVPGAPLAADLPGAAGGHYYEIAVGANWTPSANLTVRPEFRWDWSEGTAVAPYDDFTKDSQFMAAIDAIVLF